MDKEYRVLEAGISKMRKIFLSDTGHAFADQDCTKYLTCGKKHDGNAVIHEHDGSFTCSQGHNVKIAGEVQEERKCPICHSEKVIKFGKKLGRQRYGCNACGHVFLEKP